jgi:hypothetical protein
VKITVDTNVLVRSAVRDEVTQANAADADRPTSLIYLRSETQDLFQSSLPRKAICFPAVQLNVKKIHV